MAFSKGSSVFSVLALTLCAQELATACGAPGHVHAPRFPSQATILRMASKEVSARSTSTSSSSSSSGNCVASSAATSYSSLPSAVVNAISAQAIESHTGFMADPLLAGRMVGSEGELIAAKYVISRLEEAGVSPYGDNGTYIQKVPLDSVTPVSPGPLSFKIKSSATTAVSVAWSSEYVGSTQRRPSDNKTTLSSVDVVFGGYCINDSSLGWNDFAGGPDVSGKAVICLLGQPSTGVWYGLSSRWSSRWNYKAAKTSAMGAAAVLMVTTTESNYAYSSIIAQHGGVSIQNPDEFATEPLALYAWLSITATNKLATALGENWTLWHSEAASTSGFTARILNTTMSLSSVYSVERVYGNNVVGIIEGTIAPSEAVVLSGHIDHLGTVNGSIYNGARDNAAGAAAILNVATAMGASGFAARRSIIFLFSTAEEHGLYGAQYFISNIPGTVVKTLTTNINLDTPNAWGTSNNVMIIGKALSNVGTDISPWAANLDGMYTISDAVFASSGMVYRGDSWAFLTANIPAVWLGFPTNYTSSYPNGLCNWLSYFGSSTACGKVCYHMPCDIYSESIPFDGVAQNALSCARIAWAVADTRKFVPKMLQAAI